MILWILGTCRLTSRAAAKSDRGVSVWSAAVLAIEWSVEVKNFLDQGTVHILHQFRHRFVPPQIHRIRRQPVHRGLQIIRFPVSEGHISEDVYRMIPETRLPLSCNELRPDAGMRCPVLRFFSRLKSKQPSSAFHRRTSIAQADEIKRPFVRLNGEDVSRTHPARWKPMMIHVIDARCRSL